MIRWSAIGIFVLFMSGCWSEGETGDDMYPESFYCPPLNCSDQLTVYIEHKDKSDIETGEYRFELTTPKETFDEIVCTVASNASLKCDGESDALYIVLDEPENRFILRFDTTPDQVSSTISLDDELLDQSTIYPSYESITASDPACEAFCLQGTDYIRLSP